MAALRRLRAIWLSRNEAVSLGEAWEQRGMGTRSRGYQIGRSTSRIGIRLHRGTAEMDAALEEVRPAVKTQGAQLWKPSMS